MNRTWMLLGLAGVLLQAPAARAQSDIQKNYSKQIFQIPMRDGVKLFTIVYSPKNTKIQYPLLMMRTPYGIAPYQKDQYRFTLGPNPQFIREGYHFVYQDVRGCYMSEGIFENMRPQLAGKKGKTDIDESTDTYDTIDFLIKNVANHNGRVGMWGISYPGFYASAGMINAILRLRPFRRRPPSPTGSSMIFTIMGRLTCRTPLVSSPDSAKPGPSRPPAGRRGSISAPMMAINSISDSVRSRTSTNASSRMRLLTGTNLSSIPITMRFGRHAISYRISRKSLRRS